MEKKLYRSRSNKVIAGVCGGMAEYFNIDPILIRIAWILVTLVMAGSGILVYIAALLIMPQKPVRFNEEWGEAPEYKTDDFGKMDNDFKGTSAGFDPEKSKFIIGAALIVFGLVFLAKQFFAWVDVRYILPAALIGIGAIIIFRARGGSV